MRHQDLTICHRLESFVYADAAARIAAVGFVPGDVGRIAYQSDNGSYWRLTDDSPVTWQVITGSSAYASLQTTSTNPSANTTSATAVMMGMASGAGTWKITPTTTGKLLATMNGLVGNNTPNDGCVIGFRYGTGAAPANGDAAGGTPLGQTELIHNSMAAGQSAFCIQGIITGATIGTLLWFDATINAGTAGNTAGAVNLTLQIVELP